MRTKALFTALSLALCIGMLLAASTPVLGQELNRTVLPIPEPKHKPITELDARKAKAPPRFEVKAPGGAPNVVVVLLDDIGFGYRVARVIDSPASPAGRGAEV